jgi:Cap4 SAVED domain
VEAEADLLGLCAGYESGSWRADASAKHLIRHLPQFFLPIEAWDNFNTATGVEQMARAARAIYTTDQYDHRGEVGELLLFSIMREHYDSEPLVAKFYFKCSANDTVKGFDAVHLVSGEEGPELWLGEVKFYTRISAAIRDVLTELREHLDTDFLREEFMWIEQKMGDGAAHHAQIRRLLDESTSLDDVFKVLHVPILLTYRSSAISSYSVEDDAYITQIADELSKHFDTFRDKELPKHVQIHLFLVPLAGKAHLLRSFDERLKALQKV